MPRWVRDGVWALRAGGDRAPIGDSVARRAGRMGWGVRGRFMAAVIVVGVVVQPSLPTVVGAPGVEPAPLMAHLSDELSYAMKHLVASDGTRPYFINYTVYDEARAIIAASLGAIISNNADRDRKLNIDLRVGDYKLDNTHQLRGGGPSKARGNGNIELPLGDNEYAVHNALWFHTDRIFKRACKRLRQIKTNVKVKVEEDDASNDFSHERAHVYHEAPAEMVFDRDAWADRLRKISAVAREHPLIYDSRVTFGSLARTRYMVTSEGTRLQTAHRRFRITLSAATKAEDGMDLSQSVDFNAATVDGLPADAEIEAAFRGVIAQVLALRAAPLAEPYIGPAILRHRAAGVFFHEVFGHRIEGHRQKDVTEGQTFTKRIGKSVLPAFITVRDDPTLAKLGDIDLRGYYRFDDEGVMAQPVTLVADGILKTFLLSRSSVEGFPKSNGHGRRQPGFAVASRQANLIVESSKQVSFGELRDLLISECKRQDKPYGLVFEDISGGFTMTSRRGPQSFKVLPVVVYRVFTDGRPDELIRGADIVGTPLTCFEKITCTADDFGVFNGSCGAESGWVPVSAVAPSILVSEIEIEKRMREQSRPPILDSPLALNP